MKLFWGSLLAVLYATNSPAQSVFFKSDQKIKAEKHEEFYSSFSIHGNCVLFNASDYKLYAYDKTNGALLWSYYLGRRSDIPPFVAGGLIYTTAQNEVVNLDMQKGTLVKPFPLTTINSEPYIKDSILYATGINEGGILFAYDMKKDTMLWRKFLAHGCSVRPFYMADKIIANGEGNYWLEVLYSGKMKDAGCETEDEVFPSQLPCVKEFAFITHDGKTIDKKLAKKTGFDDWMERQVTYGVKNTFILADDNLHVFGNKLKLLASVSVPEISDTLEQSFAPKKILKGDEETVWILYSNHLLMYNYKGKKLMKSIDLTTWQPHQAMIDENKLWLVSKKDGLLYGITID